MEKETRFEMVLDALTFLAMIATIITVVYQSSYVVILGTWLVGYGFSLISSLSKQYREVKFKESTVDILDQIFIENNQ